MTGGQLLVAMWGGGIVVAILCVVIIEVLRPLRKK
jgi:hypothetical protein